MKPPFLADEIDAAFTARVQNEGKKTGLNFWLPPNAGKIKVNCDGSKMGKFGYAGYGGVLRDEDGLWIKGYMGYLGHSSILEAELWGIHRGLIIIYELNMQDVSIETDCQDAANCIQEVAVEGFPFSMLVQNIKDLLIRCNASIKVISREINGVADFLAKKGREKKETLVIMDDPSLTCMNC